MFKGDTLALLSGGWCWVTWEWGRLPWALCPHILHGLESPCRAIQAGTKMKLKGSVRPGHGLGPEPPSCLLMGQNMLEWEWGSQRDTGQGEEPGAGFQARASPGGLPPG